MVTEFSNKLPKRFSSSKNYVKVGNVYMTEETARIEEERESTKKD